MENLLVHWSLVMVNFIPVIGLFFFFFFQAEDGIRDHCVTGVQTCALPILFRGGGDVVAIGRLRPGVTRVAAQAEMNAIMGQIRSEHQEDSKTGVLVGPLQDWVVGDIRTSFLMLLGAVGFVLLIGCANIANLVLARSMARRKEMAIR